MFSAFGNGKKPSDSPVTGSQSGPNMDNPAPKRGHVIVIGNEKGGSGKTTTTMHLIVALLRLGFNIGSIDIDSRQRSLSRYVENRVNLSTREGVKLPMPMHAVVARSPYTTNEESEADERERFTRTIQKLMTHNDFVVIDSPGSDTYLSRFAHSFADTIITPINDSFVDLDVLATVDGNTLKIVRPSIYSEMVWEQKLLRARRDGGSIEWIVMRNRLSNIDARNKRFMGQVLAELSRRIGFRAAPGFSERVIFREMFLQGLTVLDVMDNGANTSISLSHVAARQEVRDLLKVLRIPAIDERAAQQRSEEETAPGSRAAARAATESAPLQESALASSAPSSPTQAATIRPSAAATPRAYAASHPAPPVAQPIGSSAMGLTPPQSAPGFTPPPPPGMLVPTPAAPTPALPGNASGHTILADQHSEEPPASRSSQGEESTGPVFRPVPEPRFDVTPALPSTPAPFLGEALNGHGIQTAASESVMFQQQPTATHPAESLPQFELSARTMELSPSAHAPTAHHSASAAVRIPHISAGQNRGERVSPQAQARENGFLMSSSMLQQAASALRSAAKQALSSAPRAAAGDIPLTAVPGGLPDIARLDHQTAQRQQAERMLDGHTSPVVAEDDAEPAAHRQVRDMEAAS